MIFRAFIFVFFMFFFHCNQISVIENSSLVVVVENDNNENLDELSKLLISVVDKSLSSVVKIEAENTFENNLIDSLFEHFAFFESNKKDDLIPNQTTCNLGSGFFVSNDGYVVTNYHVVKKSDKILIKTNDGNSYKAKLIGFDDKVDLALLKIELENTPYLKFFNSDHLKIGQLLVAIGNPLNLKTTTTLGILSGISRSFSSNHHQSLLQFDANINKGSSGGPLLNTNGEVIGISSSTLTVGFSFSGFGFGIPSNIIVFAINEIVKKGNIEWVNIGIEPYYINKEIANKLGIDEEGIFILSVLKNSIAEKNKLMPGDIITEYNGQKINENFHEIINNMCSLQKGTVLLLKIYRNKEFISINLKIEDKVSEHQSLYESNLQISVEDLSSSIMKSFDINPNTIEYGVIITNIDKNSQLYKEGIREGWVIKRINNEPITSKKEFNIILSKTLSKDKLKYVILLQKNNQIKLISKYEE